MVFHHHSGEFRRHDFGSSAEFVGAASTSLALLHFLLCLGGNLVDQDHPHIHLDSIHSY